MISKRVLSSISYPYLSRLTKALLILQVDPEPNVHKPLVGLTGFRPCGSGFRVFKSASGEGGRLLGRRALAVAVFQACGLGYLNFGFNF